MICPPKIHVLESWFSICDVEVVGPSREGAEWNVVGCGSTALKVNNAGLTGMSDFLQEWVVMKSLSPASGFLSHHVIFPCMHSHCDAIYQVVP
jgi:hypothetical protein